MPLYRYRTGHVEMNTMEIIFSKSLLLVLHNTTVSNSAYNCDEEECGRNPPNTLSAMDQREFHICLKRYVKVENDKECISLPYKLILR